MSSISVIGLDIAKRVFQIHGVDETGANQRGQTRLILWFRGTGKSVGTDPFALTAG